MSCDRGIFRVRRKEAEEQLRRSEAELRLSKKGPGPVTAGDIQMDHDVEIVNPDHVIAHLLRGALKRFAEGVGIRRSMALDHDAAQAQQTGPVVTARVDLAADGLEEFVSQRGRPQGIDDDHAFVRDDESGVGVPCRS